MILPRVAYGWAVIKTARKLCYNIAMATLLVLVAFAIGGVEAFGLISARLNLRGWIWDRVAALNGSFGLLGCGIVDLFGLAWRCRLW